MVKILFMSSKKIFFYIYLFVFWGGCFKGESETTYSDIISVHEDSDHSSIGDMLPTKSTINMVYLSRHVRTIQYALRFDNENDPNACDDFSGTQIYVSECGSVNIQNYILVLFFILLIISNLHYKLLHKEFVNRKKCFGAHHVKAFTNLIAIFVDNI